MTKRIRLSKEERRKQIIDSSLSVFTKKGYNGTTTLDIAREAQIAEVTLFRHFDSKEALFKEAIESLILETFEKTIEVSSDLKSFDKFKFILKDRLLFVQEYRDVIKLILTEHRINPEITHYDFISEISMLIETTVKETDLAVKDVSYLIRLIRGIKLSFLYDVEKNDDEVNVFIDQFFDMLIVSGVIEERGNNE